MVETGDLEPVVVMKGISKRFEGVHALDNVSFELLPGEIHALVGENGAGKSTLMKILCGAYTADAGDVWLGGSRVSFTHPSQAQRAGVVMVPQEINLVPYLRVYENVFLARASGMAARFLRRGSMRARARELLNRMGCAIDVEKRARELSVAQQQVVAIAKAIALDARVIVLDEPTAAITDRETQKLFEILRNLSANGVAIAYISHRLDEIFTIADRITVLRDGRLVDTRPRSELSKSELIRLMVGRELKELFPKADIERGSVILEVRNLSYANVFRDVSFTLCAGEILGIFGLMGAGRTEVAKAIFGAMGETPGEVILQGKPIRRKSPRDAVRAGVGFVTEDRKREGLFMEMSVSNNIVMATLKKLTLLGFVDHRAKARVVNALVERLRIKTPSTRRRVKYLSGGNQQKVVVAKWLARGPRVYILDEPTRGIDVGAKAEIHLLMAELLRDGAGVILISSELPEILGMSDRIIVMHEGRVTGEFLRGQVTQEDIMRCATGGSQDVGIDCFKA